MRPALADAICRARVAPGPEGLGIDFFDCRVMSRLFRQIHDIRGAHRSASVGKWGFALARAVSRPSGALTHSSSLEACCDVHTIPPETERSVTITVLAAAQSDVCGMLNAPHG